MSKTIHEKLYDAISAKELDREHVTSLLKQGADPLGVMNEWGETPIGEMFCGGYDDWGYPEKGSLSDRFPEILDIFIQNGFDCSRFQPYSDETDEHSEFWDLMFSISSGACEALKIMLDNGLPATVLDAFLDHFYLDYGLINGPEMFDDGLDDLIWAFRMIMLCASYPRILDNNEFLRACIEMDDTNKGNSYDLKGFRNYEAYDYEFDFSTINKGGMGGTTVKAIEKSTGNIVWTMHI